MSQIDLSGRPLLDIASYARRGPGRRDHLSPAEIEVIARTVRRAPEVMVKVLSRGGQDLGAVKRHLAYLNRGGELELETDDGQRLSGRGVEKTLLEDWDLDLEEHRRRSDLDPRARPSSPKLVHKLLFSMPPGTPPAKVLEAVKNFAREEFGAIRRYAMVMHTDEPHPHVHVVVKAISERGERLNVRKATLRKWRTDFAKQLRKLGVAANATERAVRGASGPRWRDAIYRADLRGDSTVVRKREASLRQELRNGASQSEKKHNTTLLQTRRDIEAGWLALTAWMTKDGATDMANRVLRFMEQMPAGRTDIEWLAYRARARSREVDALIR